MGSHRDSVGNAGSIEAGDVSLSAYASFPHPVERGHAAFAYVFEGERAFGVTDAGTGKTCSHLRLVVFDDGDAVRVVTADQPVRFLLVSGQPLHEPIARYGPFVMNTRQEIEQALRDLQKGTFVEPATAR